MIQNKKRIISLILMLTLLVSSLVVGAITASATDGTWTLVTDASELAAGDKVVIVAKDYDYAMSTTQNKNNRGQAAVSKSGNSLTFTSSVQEFTLEEGAIDGSFAFNAGDAGYICAASSGSNYLRTKTSKDANASWKIEISDGNTTITAQGSYTRKVMQYNLNSSLFACYSSASQKAICIYKFETVAADHICSSETLSLVEAKDSTCTQAGNIAYYACSGCSEIYEDANAETLTTLAAVTKALADHDLTHHSENAATCTEDGNVEYWTCSECEKFFSDEACKSEIAEKDTVIPAEGHKIVDGKCSVCGEAADVATLVTDISTLTAGRKIIIVAKDYDYAMSITQNSNNRAQASVTKSGNTIAFGNDVQIITLETGLSNGTFAFKVATGYLYAASSNSNHLKTQTTLIDNGSWAIEISDDGVATIKAKGSSTRNWLRYNASNNPPIFSCYGSGQTDVCIYVLPCDHTYVDGVCSVCGHKAETFAEAITGTGTVQVPKGGVTVAQLTVHPGLVIDLNGQVLKATSLVTFAADAIIDSSAKGENGEFVEPTGLLIIPQFKIVIPTPGLYMPIWNTVDGESGYQFVKMEDQQKVVDTVPGDDSFNVVFRPSIGDTAFNNKIFGDVVNNGLEFVINVYNGTLVDGEFVAGEFVDGEFVADPEGAPISGMLDPATVATAYKGDKVKAVNVKFTGADFTNGNCYSIELFIRIKGLDENGTETYINAYYTILAVVGASGEIEI